MPSTSLFTRLVTSNPRRKKSDAHDKYVEEASETPLSRVPLGQGRSKAADSQPESKTPTGSSQPKR